MKKSVKLVLVPCSYDKLEVGMYIKVRTDNELGYRYSYIHHFFDAPLGQCFSSTAGELTHHGADFVGNIIDVVEPYFISDDKVTTGDLVLYGEDVVDILASKNCPEEYDFWLGDGLNGCAVKEEDCKKIIATPKQIGLIYSDENKTNTGNCTFYKEVRLHYIKEILEKELICELDMEQINSNDFAWVGDKNLTIPQYKIKFINNQVVIYLSKKTE